MNKNDVDYNIGECSLYGLFNHNEYLVLEVMRELFALDKTLCRCMLCVEDIYALSLNSLPARYIQDVRQSEYEASSNYIDKEKITASVKKAMEKVYRNPSH